jgi:hypothetical protein
MYRAKKILKQLKAEKLVKPAGAEGPKPTEFPPASPSSDAAVASTVADDAAKKV